jgi:FtsP/CotA-like multicopper oxidase with cupredoxin domain
MNNEFNKNDQEEGRDQMNRRKYLIVLMLLMIMTVIPWGIGQHDAQARVPVSELSTGANGYYVPDYFATPNWANSPPLTKFADGLPGICGATVGPAANLLDQCIPIAVPTILSDGSEYYEIELVQYRERMHQLFNVVNNADKMAATAGGTKLRGYRQTNTADVNLLTPHYLGPIIVATKYDSAYAPGAAMPGGKTNGRPVRIKFTNSLPAGDLFLPVDTSVMGSGAYRINYDPATKATIPQETGSFSQNRGSLHLHGGRTPWISDGTPHQWTAPVAEGAIRYGKGVSVAYVPDMWFTAAGAAIDACFGQTTCATTGATNNPGPGKQTYYYTNQQSSRLMFYHDHAWGITRLNVYAGEAAGYLVKDPTEEAAITAGTIPNMCTGGGAATCEYRYGIPLIIQDKTFVNASITNVPLGVTADTYTMATDPTWAWGSAPGKPNTATPTTGDLWWPHVYMTAQNPFNPDLSGTNAMGRWHYGPWFFPATPLCGSSAGAVPPFCITTGPQSNPYYLPAYPEQPPQMPGTPHPSWGAEAFLDTMMVNGTAYPTVTLGPQEYRFRILNASHDRFLNLQLYRATSIVDPSTFLLTGVGAGYTSVPTVTIAGAGGGTGATATATVDLTAGSPTLGQVTSLTLDTVGSGYAGALTITFTGGGATTPATATGSVYTSLTEVGMVPAALTSGFPANWPADGREGGVPDPTTRGPAFVQIGTEGGFLPKPAVLPNQPVRWNMDPTMFNVGNVLQQRDGGGTLLMGPAERADVIVDFSSFAGQTLILYNDAPTAFPALAPQYDYYTGAPSRIDTGGYIGIPPGVGPNIRTVMQIVVTGPQVTPIPDDYNAANLTARNTAFAGTSGVFQSSQEPIVVGQTAYNETYVTTFPAVWPNWGLSRISDGSISFQKVDGTIKSNFEMKPKAIHDEMGATFDDYGRMAAKLGLERPFTNAAIANFILQNFVDPATEKVKPGEVQIWRITHNGVDTHPIHFHLFDVQVLNRVGWDGFIRLPDDNELGWKDTVRVSPLEDTIVAFKVVAPVVPFTLPNSIRPLNPAFPTGSEDGFSQMDPATGDPLLPPQTNVMTNFGHEYVWHCHILSHEENDMMRPISLNADQLLYVVNSGNGTWQWDMGTWTQINAAVPTRMVASGTLMYAIVPGSGLWQWDGTAWTKLNNNVPTDMVVAGSNLYVTFVNGLYKWNGTTWSRLDGLKPAIMVASGANLYAKFSGNGLWQWNGTVWTKLNNNDPTDMVVAGSNLYVTFVNGLYKWNGMTWSRLDGLKPAIMVASGSSLYADFAGAGLWKWEANVWNKISSTDSNIMASGF